MPPLKPLNPLLHAAYTPMLDCRAAEAEIKRRIRNRMAVL